MPLWLSEIKSKTPKDNKSSSLYVLSKQLKISCKKLSAWIVSDIVPSPKDIKKLAEHYNLSQSNLAEIKQCMVDNNTLPYVALKELTGIPAASFVDWSSGKKLPSLPGLLKLSDWLKVPPAALLLENIETTDAPDVKIIELLNELTPGQKLYFYTQMEEYSKLNRFTDL